MTDSLAIKSPKVIKPVTGWHVVGWLGLLFGIMFAINGLFIYLALKTFSGETDHAYLNGLKFNETISARQKQAETGWSMKLDLVRDANGGSRVNVTLLNKEGAPVRGATLVGSIGRPVTTKQDHVLVFTETRDGLYESAPVALGPGRWTFVASAKTSGNPDFRTETTLSLR
jgi:nitrogen fixation protein FixH